MVPFLLNGPIVPNDDKWIYDLFGMDAVCPADLRKYLSDQQGQPINIVINSPGGYVAQGCEMYSLLIQQTQKVTATVESWAASAASMILCAADTVRISPVAQIMIHNAHAIVEGDYRDMIQAKDNLQQINAIIADAYAAKTGQDKAALLKMMDEESIFNASKALELHFADEILAKKPTQAVAAYGGGLLPPSCIEKMRAELQDRKSAQQQAAVAIEKASLEYLSLKGE